MLVLNKFLERGHHEWQMQNKIHSEAEKRVPLSTLGDEILGRSLRSPPLSVCVLYNLLSLGVDGNGDYYRIVISLF